MEVHVSSKYIEGFTEECMRQGFTPEQTTAALELALEKQANVFSRGWNWLIGNNDTPIHDEHARAVEAANTDQAATRRAYNEAISKARYYNTHYADGTRREKPLQTDENELKASAASDVVLNQINDNTKSDMSTIREEIDSIKRRMAALDPNDTGTRASLQRRLDYWHNRANIQGRKADLIQSRAFGGYGVNNNAINVTYGKNSGKAWYKPWTWFDAGEHKHTTYADEVRQRNNRLQREYDEAKAIKDSWGGFSWMHPDTWFAPSEAEIANAQRQMDQFNAAQKSRNQLMHDMGPEAMARAQRDIQQMIWGGVTADGYTLDRDYRRQLVEQNKGLRRMYNNNNRPKQ